jgi:uncharacterized protein (TIGR03067 family)
MVHALAGCVLAFLVGAEPLNDAARKDLKALEGEWRVVRVETRGMGQNLGDELRVDVVIEGTKITLRANGKDVETGDIAALDPSTTPKIFDTKNRKTNVVVEGIYKLEGDDWSLCRFVGKPSQRPTSFETPKDEGTLLIKLKRVKK